MRLESVRIPYYVVKKGNGFWQPTKKMRALGFTSVPCGPDGPEAWAKAEACNERWKSRPFGVGRGGTVVPLTPGERGYVYFLKVGDSVKIGFSTKPFTRLQNLQIGNAGRIDLFVAVQAERRDESRLHRLLGSYRERGEWFAAHPAVMRAIACSAKCGRPVHMIESTQSERKLEHGPTFSGEKTLSH